MQKAECPQCEREAEVGSHPAIGKMVRCGKCGVELGIGWLDPWTAESGILLVNLLVSPNKLNKCAGEPLCSDSKDYEFSLKGCSGIGF